jgi:hypothetical protein
MAVTAPMPDEHRPSLLRTPLVIVGALVTTVSALLFLVGFVLDLFGLHTNPYLGILFFLALPAAFVFGLLLIPLGMGLERRRRLLGRPPSLRTWPRFDLNHPRVRTAVFVVLVLTPVNVLIVGMAGYKGVEYMDSVAFCGTVCHEVMEPEYVAYQFGPHARVRCVDCHIGPGADWFVRSKLSGARQVVAVMMASHPRPIPTPVHDLRPARETCEQCHWPDKFHGDKVELFRDYADDEANTETVTAVRLRIGGIDLAGEPTGIHWHVAEQNAIEYIALDSGRQEIGWVQIADADGTPTEYRAPGVTDEQLARGERRRMDCVDCHNRPSHTFARSSDRAINELLASGAVPLTLPFVRREGHAAITGDYASQAEAFEAIGARLRGFYRDQHPEVWAERRDDVERAVAALGDLYRRNVFPSMRVTWGLHADNRGHMEFPGCFRCHTDEHAAPDGRVIRQDCSLCHEFE